MDDEFEITRPRLAPELHRWMLAEKLRRAVAGLAWLRDSTALVVCGGSGMDADFLEAGGARVVTSDISLGAALRARERARRFGLGFASVVADIEQLPFADDSFDLVYVHDGLHHLESHDRALAEMARVAHRAVVISEPAAAAITSLAVRIGLAREREEPGNRIQRLRPADLAASLGAAGYRTTRRERYVLRYGHVPGRLTAMLSRRPLGGAVKLGWRIVNVVFARHGNKLVLVAERMPPARVSDRRGVARQGWS